MYRLGAAIVFSVAALAQMDLRSAVKSPVTLAQYIESHDTFDWDAFWSAIGRKDPDVMVPPCGLTSEGRCSVSIESILSPEQSIVIIQGDDFRTNDIYVRYLRDGGGGWRFAGERRAYLTGRPRRHEITRIWGKPFLKVLNDFTQNGMGIYREFEEWFDLTQQDFTPVFSITVDGGENGFGYRISRRIGAQAISAPTRPDRIDVWLTVKFEMAYVDAGEIRFVGEYVRPPGQTRFQLRVAHKESSQEPLTARDFERLGSPFEGPSNERLLRYAFDGLQQIASGDDKQSREQLKMILGYSQDTPEKRALLKLLAAKP